MPLLVSYSLLSQVPPPPAHDATARSARRASKNAVRTKFTEYTFHEVGGMRWCQSGGSCCAIASGRSHKETRSACIVFRTTIISSAFRLSRSISSLSLAKKASKVLLASYLRRYSTRRFFALDPVGMYFPSRHHSTRQ